MRTIWSIEAAEAERVDEQQKIVPHYSLSSFNFKFRLYFIVFFAGGKCCEHLGRVIMCDCYLTWLLDGRDSGKRCFFFFLSSNLNR